MSEETKKTSEEQETEKEIPVTDGNQEEENLTPEGEDLPEEENNTPGEEAASEDKKEEKSKTSFFGKKKPFVFSKAIGLRQCKAGQEGTQHGKTDPGSAVRTVCSRSSDLRIPDYVQ